jgi:hypothetical protein
MPPCLLVIISNLIRFNHICDEEVPLVVGESWLNSSFGEISICSGNIMLAGKKNMICATSLVKSSSLLKKIPHGTKTPAGYHLVD